MPSLYILKRGLSSIRSASEKLILFNSIDMSGRSTIIDSKTLHLDHIHDFTLRLLGKVTSDMDGLLFHHPIFTIEEGDFVHDDPRSLDPGYSFVDDNRNSWRNKMTALEHILTTPDLRDRFAYVDSHGRVRWKPGACHTHMVDIYRLQMNLFLLVLFTFGAPGRGTEMLSHLFRNISGGSIRNIFVLFNLFVLRGSFNKTSNVTLRDRTMVRVPLIAVGRLWIRFLVFLRPLYAEWQCVFHPHMHTNATHFLFAGLYRPVVTADLSLTISVAFREEFGIKMSLGRFRQWMSFMMSCNSRIFSAVQTATATGTDDQIGHSLEMGMDFYDHDLQLPEGLDRKLYIQTARTSASAQLMFGHPPDLLLALCQGHEWQNGIIHLSRTIMDGKYVPPGQEIVSHSLDQTPGPAITPHSVASAIRDQVIPELTLHLNRTLTQSHASVVELLTPNRRWSQVTPLRQAVQAHTHPFFLEYIRRFRRSEDKTLGFTGTSQAEVTQLLYDGQRNVGYFAATGKQNHIIIAPTSSETPIGTGKTTPALINAALDVGKSTLWCLPLKSMHHQYHILFAQHSMSCETWSTSTSSTSPPRNILVIIEHLDSVAFHDFAQALVAACLLSRIIVDEAHLALTHDSFRLVMHTLQWIGSLGLPIALLSATVGPSLVDDLFAKFGITHYVICREKTSRPNISYRVVPSADLELSLDALLQTTVLQPGKDQALIFCRTTSQAERSARHLQVPFCHGGMTLEQIDLVLEQLRSGNTRVVVCTGVLGVALNVPSIRWTFHLDYPYDMLSYIQESGRTGRAPGSDGISYVIIPESNVPQLPKHDRFGARLIVDWAKNSSQCRRWLMHLFNDGVAEPCSMMAGVSNMCDACERASIDSPQRGAPNTLSVDDILPYLPPHPGQ
jgi:hypothetical protein